MTQSITFKKPFDDSHIQRILQTFSDEIGSFTKLTAKEWGEQKPDLTTAMARTVFYTPLEQKVKATMDKIRKHIAISAIVFDVQQVEKAVKKQIADNGIAIIEKRELVNSLIQDRQALAVNPNELRALRRSHLFAWCAGIADGCLAASTFLVTGYGLLAAIMSAAIIAFAIGYSHKFYAGWIRTAPTVRKQYIRNAIILAAALIFFSALGFLRASAITDIPDIALQGEYVATTHVPHFIGWIIAAVSWLLFTVIFFLALKHWRSKEQEATDNQYCDLTKRIGAEERSMNALVQESKALEANMDKQKADAVERAAYLKAAMKQCTNIANEAVANFRRLYARYHGSIPDHFNDSPNVEFDESLHIVNHENQNRA